MKSLAPSRRLALSTLLLACAPAFAAPLSGTVQDASGRPVAGALVVGASAAGKDDTNGAPHRWVATSDDAGRFALQDFPPGPCHVTANADAAGSGQERDRCDAGEAAATREATIVVRPLGMHVGGHVKLPSDAPLASGAIVFLAHRAADGSGPMVVYGTRVVHELWALALPDGTWSARAVTPAVASGSTRFLLPGRTAPIDLDLAAPRGSHPEIADELHALAVKDQAVRNAFIAAHESDASAAAMTRADGENLARLKQIIRRHGWPTGALVGNDAMGDVWTLTQHAPGPFIAQALPHLKAAADRGEIAWSSLALMIDRDLTDRKKPQLYGSQATLADGKMTLLPVRDEAHLDERRAQVGLGPEADYLAQLQKLYLPAGTP